MDTMPGHGRYDSFVRKAIALSPMRTAVVHPCSEETLRSAIDLKTQGLLDPLLVGPEHRIRAIAEAAVLSLAGIDIEPVEHSHAAADRAVELASTGKVAALMKGSLHSDELLSAVVSPASRLRTDRRISHVYVMDVPAYNKLLVITMLQSIFGRTSIKKGTFARTPSISCGFSALKDRSLQCSQPSKPSTARCLQR